MVPQESRAVVGKLTASLQHPSAYLMTAAQRILADCYWGDAQAEGARCRGELRPSGELTDAESQEYWGMPRYVGGNGSLHSDYNQPSLQQLPDTSASDPVEPN